MARRKKKLLINGIEFKSATVDWQDASSALSLPVEYLNPEGIEKFPPVQHAKGYVAKIGKTVVIVNQVCGGEVDCTVVPLAPEVGINYD